MDGRAAGARCATEVRRTACAAGTSARAATAGAGAGEGAILARRTTEAGSSGPSGSRGNAAASAAIRPGQARQADGKDRPGCHDR